MTFGDEKSKREIKSSSPSRTLTSNFFSIPKMMSMKSSESAPDHPSAGIEVGSRLP